MAASTPPPIVKSRRIFHVNEKNRGAITLFGATGRFIAEWMSDFQGRG